LDSVLASWEKAENAIKKARMERKRFFMEVSFGAVIYGNTLFFSIISRKVDKPQRAWKAAELMKKYTEPGKKRDLFLKPQ
jgi:hypothetical protein